MHPKARKARKEEGEKAATELLREEREQDKKGTDEKHGLSEQEE